MLESVSQPKGLLNIAFGEHWEVLKWPWVCVWITGAQTGFFVQDFSPPAFLFEAYVCV